MTVLTCRALLGFGNRRATCGKPATYDVTISGAGVAFDVQHRPTCTACERIDRRIIEKYFAKATIVSTRIGELAHVGR